MRNWVRPFSRSWTHGVLSGVCLFRRKGPTAMADGDMVIVAPQDEFRRSVRAFASNSTCRLTLHPHVSFQTIGKLYATRLTGISFSFIRLDTNTSFTLSICFLLPSLRQLMQYYKPLGVSMVKKEKKKRLCLGSGRLGISKEYLYPIVFRGKSRPP